jgi:hypothetical protein
MTVYIRRRKVTLQRLFSTKEQVMTVYMRRRKVIVNGMLHVMPMLSVLITHHLLTQSAADTNI